MLHDILTKCARITYRIDQRYGRPPKLQRCYSPLQTQTFFHSVRTIVTLYR